MDRRSRWTVPSPRAPRREQTKEWDSSYKTRMKDEVVDIRSWISMIRNIEDETRVNVFVFTPCPPPSNKRTQSQYTWGFLGLDDPVSEWKQTSRGSVVSSHTLVCTGTWSQGTRGGREVLGQTTGVDRTEWRVGPGRSGHRTLCSVLSAAPSWDTLFTLFSTVRIRE